MDTLYNPQNAIYSPIEEPKSIEESWKEITTRFKVKQPTWLVVAGIIFCGILYFIFDRIQFLSIAERVTGIVSNISAYNDRCWWKHKYDCTEFTATVDFMTLHWEKNNFSISWGSERGHNQPISYSSRRIGGAIAVAYDPANIERVYEDTLWGIWWTPIMAFFLQIISFISAFSEPKKRNN